MYFGFDQLNHHINCLSRWIRLKNYTSTKTFPSFVFSQKRTRTHNLKVKTVVKPLNEDDNALMQTGNNHSDDLFMFIKKKVTGLEPNKTYSLAFTVEFATNAPEGSIGIGGSPASSVYIKAGASTAEPEKELDDDNYYRMNIDKGNQASGGANMLVLGDFSNGTENEIYTLVTLTSEESITVETDDMGEAWIILGTDSGFEATTTIYYTTIKVDFK